MYFFIEKHTFVCDKKERFAAQFSDYFVYWWGGGFVLIITYIYMYNDCVNYFISYISYFYY